MFLDFHNLNTNPFEERIAPDRMLQDPRISQGIERFEYLVQSGIVGLLLGGTGLGKTSLIRLLISRLEGNKYHPLHVHLSNVASASLLRHIVTALGEKPKLGKDRLFCQILEKIRPEEKTTVLIIDEAHLLAEEALTDLRLLVSAGFEEDAKLKLLLCGQGGLGRILQRHTLADLANRITVRHQLFPLMPEQTSDYMDHRVKSAGGSAKLFDEEAKGSIHQYASGIPRNINNLATVALIQAASQKQSRITEAIIKQAAAELRMA